MNNSNVNQMLSTSSAQKAETPKEASEAEAAMAVMNHHFVLFVKNIYNIE
jgi:hypothetical protein